MTGIFGRTAKPAALEFELIRIIHRGHASLGFDLSETVPSLGVHPLSPLRGFWVATERAYRPATRESARARILPVRASAVPMPLGPSKVYCPSQESAPRGMAHAGQEGVLPVAGACGTGTQAARAALSPTVAPSGQA